MKKTKRIMTIGSLAIAVAPVAVAISCGTAGKDFLTNGGVVNRNWNFVDHDKIKIQTEYSREHEMLLSLGIAPTWHARSDLSSTHKYTNEGYLLPYSPNYTRNGDSYGSTDKESITRKNIDYYIARHINDTKGKFENIGEKIDVVMSGSFADNTKPRSFETYDQDSWIASTKTIASEIQNQSQLGTKLDDHFKVILDHWKYRKAQLLKDAKKWHANNKKGLDIGIMVGSDDGLGGFLPKWHAMEMYGLDGIRFPNPTDAGLLAASKGKSWDDQGAWRVEGKKDAAQNSANLVSAFADKFDKIIYTLTPEFETKAITDNTLWSSVLTNLKKMLKDPVSNLKSKILVKTYDNYLLPFEGAVIGNNVVMDNIEHDIFGKDINQIYGGSSMNKDVESTNWKDDFDPTKLAYKRSDILHKRSTKGLLKAVVSTAPQQDLSNFTVE